MNPTDAVATTPQREEVLADLVEEITQAIEAGQPVDISAYATRYPQFAEEIKRMVPTFLVLEDLGLSAVRPRVPAASSSTPTRSIGGNLGDFRLVREIGRGGMGVVYEAEQMSLGRRMALKVLPLAGVLDERQLTRFRNEARAAASLKHPNIVGVHSVGCERGVHYYAMEYVEGKTLAEVIAELRRESGGATEATEGPTQDGPAKAQQPLEAAHSGTPQTPSPEDPQKLVR